MTQLDEYFKFKCKKGLQVRLAELNYPVDEKIYWKQLDYETDLLVKMGFPGYFLIVADIVNWCNKNDILVGPGRGSASGALTSFSLGITTVDPIKYGLYFERFINPERVSFPDIDLDFQKSKRHLVIQYIKDKYGNDKVAQIGTFGTFKAKAAIKGIARTLNLPLQQANQLCKLYPRPVHGKDIKFQEALDKVPELKVISESNTLEGEVLRWAQKIEGRTSSYGCHASGVIISNLPINQIAPLGRSKDGDAVTQWDMKNIEDVGLIKFDILGLKTLDLIDQALQFIFLSTGKKLDIYKTPINDEDTFTLLKSGNVCGVFQLEASSGIKDLTVKVQPNSIEDISAINSIYRPGPLQSKGLPTYLTWRSGQLSKYLHPDMEPLLKETGGFLIYQEQLLAIANKMAGFTLGECDLLRRCVGKKITSEMMQQKAKFIDGFITKNYKKELAETIWSEIVGFADYCLGEYQEILTTEGMIKISELQLNQLIPTINILNQKVEIQPIVDIWCSGVKEVRRYFFDNLTFIDCTPDHKFLTKQNGFQPIQEILDNNLELDESCLNLKNNFLVQDAK